MDTFNELIRTKDITLEYFELSEEDLSKTYAPGKWNIKQILHHIVDAEMVINQRIKRIIANPEQIIQAFDQDAWCDNLGYSEMPLIINQNLYTSIRLANIYLFEKFYLDYGPIEFTHSETGTRTLTQEFDKIVLHNANHLEQIEKALGNFDHFKYN